MEHIITGDAYNITDIPGQEKNVEAATKENPVNLEADKDLNKDGKRRKKLTSPVWEHFTKLPNCAEGMEKAKCNYCKVIVSCNTFANGFSLLPRPVQILKSTNFEGWSAPLSVMKKSKLPLPRQPMHLPRYTCTWYTVGFGIRII